MRVCLCSEEREVEERTAKWARVRSEGEEKGFASVEDMGKSLAGVAE